MKFICIGCGNEFEKESNDRNKYCRQLRTFTCGYCGKEFETICQYRRKLRCDNCKNKSHGHKLSEETKLKMKNTLLDRYGVEYPLQSSEIKNKVMNTKKERYGYSTFNMNKTKETVINKYGVDSVFKSEEIKNRIRETNLKRYGTYNPMKNEDIKSKSISTNLKKYNSRHYLMTEDGKNKLKDSVRKKYGVDNVFQMESVKDKSRQTNIKRYGTAHPMKSDKVKNKTKNTCKEKYGNKSYIGSEDWRTKTIETCMEKYGVDYPCMTDNCRNASRTISKINLEFSKMLDRYGINSELEFGIDKYSYDIKIDNFLIEIDPTPTHNINWNPWKHPVDKNYHINKTRLANENGYRCIHVFDWDDKDKIVDLVNPNKRRVYARNCCIKIINDNKISNEFLFNYHLQGTCRNQDIIIGLYNNDELLQIMTFGRPRYNKNYQYELLRLCTKNNTVVVGGAEKLFNYFIHNYNPYSIISYCDNSKFRGDIYTRLGMELLDYGNPTCHWYNGDRHITDNLLRKQGFDRLFGTSYGKGTDNNQLMLDHGFVQIYDCGQSVYVWNKK